MISDIAVISVPCWAPSPAKLENQMHSVAISRNFNEYSAEFIYKTGFASKQKRVVELESLRGIAAIFVVLYHIPKWNPILNIGFKNNGYLMVEFFFVLSGFVIYNAYHDRIKSRKDFLRFQFLRFGRLYPVHITFLCVFLLIELAKYFAMKKFLVSIPNSKPFVENNFTAFIEQIFLIQAIGPTGKAFTFNSAAWSISVEFYTYIMFGIIILFAKNYKIIIFSTIAVISLMALQLGMTYGFDYLLRCLAGFFTGCITAWNVKDKKFSIPNFVPLILFFIIFLYLEMKPVEHYDIVIYFLTSLLIVSLVFSDSGILKTILNLKIFTWLGMISYSLYMSHGAVEWTVNQFIRMVLKKPELTVADGVSIPQMSALESIAGSIFIIISALAAGALTYYLIERPMRTKSIRFADKNITKNLV